MWLDSHAASADQASDAHSGRLVASIRSSGGHLGCRSFPKCIHNHMHSSVMHVRPALLLSNLWLWGLAGLVGPFPNMSADGASKFQAWSAESTGFSQPCSINSPKWGGSAADINVQDMQDLSEYKDCLPNFLEFDTSAGIRVAYGDSINCPLTKWVVPAATASDTVRSSGGTVMQRRHRHAV